MNDFFGRNRDFIIVFALAALVFGAFLQVLGHEFVYDDGIYIVKNPHLQKGLTSESFAWALTTTRGASWHPVTWLSHLADCGLFGFDPAGHHLVNLLLHMVNTAFVFLVLKRMTGAVGCSVFVAALFGVHPLHIESVAWVSERKDVLSFFFAFLSLWAYIRDVEQPRPGRYLLVLGLFVLSLLSKPMMVTLPCLLLVLDYWPFSRMRFAETLGKAGPASTSAEQPESGRHSFISLLVEKIPFFVIVIAFSIITFLSQEQHGAMAMISDTTPLLRIQNALLSYGGYIIKTLFPQGLAIHYPFPSEIPFWKPVAVLALLFGITIVIFRFWKCKYLAMGWFWYLGTLVPVIGFVQVGTQGMADRYMYLPSVGLFVIVAWSARDLMARRRYGKAILRTAGVLICSLLTFCTVVQLKYWKNDITLYARAVAVCDDNYIMLYKYGDALARGKQMEEAVRHLKKAVELQPREIEFRARLASVYENMGQREDALREYETTLQINPDMPLIHTNVGLLLYNENRIEEAMEHLNRAVDLNPENFDAYSYLGTIYAKKEEYDRAVTCFRNALKIKPNNRKIRSHLESALRLQKEQGQEGR